MSERALRAMSIARLLTAAKDHLAGGARWGKRFFGRDANGVELGDDVASYDRAVAMCADGACRKAVASAHALPLYEETTAALATAIRGEDTRDPAYIWQFNDDLTTKYDDVALAFDIAIADQCKIVREEAEKQKDSP